MSDETTTSERVGFCQDCGRPLSRIEARTVGQGVFCEPCLHARLTGTPSAQSAAPNAGYTAPAAAPAYGDGPHPWLAATLGVIPGVGAMYNGQFVKGLAQLVIFAVLVSLKEHVSDVFGIFVFAWICFMSFDAYHTARARRDGLPLPNAFGLNDIGEKMGFGKTWGTVAQVRQQAPPPAAAQTTTVPPPPTPSANWVGYVPPSAPGASYSAATSNAPVPPTPYSTPYAPVSNAPMPPVPMPGSSFPLIAVWLIGLGVLFTLAEWVPMWRLNSSSVVAILLGAIAASVIVRRLGYMGGMSYPGPMLHMMRGPIILAVLAVMFLLQGVHAATLLQTFPLIFLALGAVLLAERLGVGAQPYPQNEDAGSTSVIPPASESATASATTTKAQHSDEGDGYSR